MISKKRAEFYILLTALGWSFSSIIVKQIAEDIPVFHMMFARYLMALFIFYLFKGREIRENYDKSYNRISVVLGALMFIAYALGIAALYFTTASKAGFMISLSVLFVPIVTSIMKKSLPNKWIMFSVFLSVIGLYYISGMNGTSFNFGDLLAVSCALVYTFYIIIVDSKAKDMNSSVLTSTQFVVVMILSFIIMIIVEGFHPEYIASTLWYLLALSILGTALTSFLQLEGQKVATPEAVGIILLGEPLFTIIMAVFILNEVILFKGIVGAILITAALVITIIKDA